MVITMTTPQLLQPNTREEYKAWLGERLPRGLVCYQCWPVIDKDQNIVDFVFPNGESTWDYMFLLRHSLHTYRLTYNETLDAYCI